MMKLTCVVDDQVLESLGLRHDVSGSLKKIRNERQNVL